MCPGRRVRQSGKCPRGHEYHLGVCLDIRDCEDTSPTTGTVGGQIHISEKECKYCSVTKWAHAQENIPTSLPLTSRANPLMNHPTDRPANARANPLINPPAYRPANPRANPLINPSTNPSADPRRNPPLDSSTNRPTNPRANPPINSTGRSANPRANPPINTRTGPPANPPTNPPRNPPRNPPPNPPANPPAPQANPNPHSIVNGSTNPVFQNLNQSQGRQVDLHFQFHKRQGRVVALQDGHVWSSEKDVEDLAHICGEARAEDYAKKLPNAGGRRIPKATPDEKDKCWERIIKRFGPDRLPDNFSPDDGYTGFPPGSRAEKAFLAGRRSQAPVQSPQAGHGLDNPSSQQHENRAQPSALQGGRAVGHNPRHGAQAQQPHIQDDQLDWRPDPGDVLYYNPSTPSDTGRQVQNPLRAGSDDIQGPGAPPFSGRMGLTPFRGNSEDASGESDPENPRSRQPSLAAGGGLPNIAGQSPLGRGRATSKASSGFYDDPGAPGATGVSSPASSDLRDSPQMPDHVSSRQSNSPVQGQSSARHAESLDPGYTGKGKSPMVPHNLAAGQTRSRSSSGSNQSPIEIPALGGGSPLRWEKNPFSSKSTQQPSGSMPKPQAKKSKNVTHAAGSPGQGFVGSPPSAAFGSPPPSSSAPRREVSREISNLSLRQSASPAASTPAATTPPIRQGTPRVQQARPTTPSGPTSAPRDTTPHRNPAPHTVAPVTGAGRGQGTGGAPRGSGNQGPAKKSTGRK